MTSNNTKIAENRVLPTEAACGRSVSGLFNGAAKRLKAAFFTLLLAGALGSGLGVGFGVDAQAAEVGGTYYTQYNFWVEKDKNNTTNYSRGELIPFNTQVELISIDKKKVVISANGRQFQIINKPKYTQKSPNEIADTLLASQKVNLAGIPEDRQSDMRNGILRLGMSKDQTVITRGYPPRHETPSNDANRWVYWTSRFVKLTLVFENGKLARGRGLY